MTIDIAALREKLEKATPGPWRAEREPAPTSNDYFDRHTEDGSTPIESNGTHFALGVAVGVAGGRTDAALIVAAVNGLGELLDIAEAARETHTRWCDGIDCPLCPVLGKPVRR